MRKMFSLLLMAWAVAFASCSKEGADDAMCGFSDAVTESGEYATATIRILSGGVAARAYPADGYLQDDGVSRLDLYFFHMKDKRLDEHRVIYPEQWGVTTVTLTEKQDEEVGVLVYANLDEDTAKYFEGKTLKELADEDSNNDIIFSAGNFSPDHIPMAGSTLLSFYKDAMYDVELHRLMCRIDVKTLNIFDNPEFQGKEVFVKKIIIANATNYFPAVSSAELNKFGDPSIFFGKEEKMDNAFGGVQYGIKWWPSFSSTMINGVISPGGDGKMGKSYPRLLNNNYKQPRGVLVADADGAMGDATIQRYDNGAGEGLVVSAGDMARSHSFAVNRSFYTFFGSMERTDGVIMCDYKDQSSTQKLVVELSIDGEPYYYPIELTHTQPNTVYDVKSINIRNPGSEYSNFYEKMYSVDVEMSVKEWSMADVDNIDVGYKDGGKKEIY